MIFLAGKAKVMKNVKYYRVDLFFENNKNSKHSITGFIKTSNETLL